MEEKNMLSVYNEVTGREFGSVEEAVEHLENLQKLAFSKQDTVKAELQKEFDAKVAELQEKAKEEVRKELNPYKKFVEEAKIDLTKTNPLAIAEYIGEQHEDIKPRVDAKDEQAELESLKKQARRGSEVAKIELVKRTMNATK